MFRSGEFAATFAWALAGTWLLFGMACATPEQRLPVAKSARPRASPAQHAFDASNETPKVDGGRGEQRKIELPWASNAMDLVEAPTVSVVGRDVLVDGERVDEVVDEVVRQHRLRGHDGLFRAMKALREKWKSAHPGEEFPGVVLFRFDRWELSAVVKSVFQTVAFAGFPNASFIVDDHRFDQAVVHVPNDVEFQVIVAAVDALYQPKRPFTFVGKTGEQTEEVPSFNVTLAVN